MKDKKLTEKCPPGYNICNKCFEQVKDGEDIAHSLEKHDALYFKSLSHEEQAQVVQIDMTHYFSKS